jgi:hypothetical protein
MKLITFEFLMKYVDRPDWWQKGDVRVQPEEVDGEFDRMVLSERYRNIEIKDDPHDQHTAKDIETSTSGMGKRCKVPGCTWTWDYD